MKACPNDSLVSLYEEVSYKYSPVTTAYSDLKMPAKDWYIPAFDGQHWGYILANGRTALNFQYEEATCFAGSYAVVKLNGVYTLIDKDGYWNAVDKNGLDEVVSICGSRVAAIKDGQYGIYTNTFNRLGNETYEDVILNDNGMVAVKKDGKWFLLDSELEPVTDTQFLEVVPNSRGQLFASGYAVVADEEGYFLIDEWGNACFGTRFADAKGLEGGLFAVADASGKWGFSNENGELVVDCQYGDACSFSDRLAAVQYGGDWGYINKYNTMVIEPQFTKAYPFLNGTALAVDELGNYRILTLKYYEMF